MVSPSATDGRAVEAAEVGQSAPAGTGDQGSTNDAMNAWFNDAFRSTLGDPGPATSYGQSAAESEADETAGGESAPSGDVNPNALAEGVRPTADGLANLPRRAKPLKAALDEVTAERDRLKAERDAEIERVRAETRAEMQPRVESDADRYQRLVHLPIDDAQLYELAPDGQQNLGQWLEGYKQKLITHPEVEKHYQTVADQRIAHAGDAFRASMRSQIEATATLPGVDLDAFKRPGITWTDMARHYHEAGAATASERLAAVEAENADLKRQLFGSLPRPVQPGRSSGDSGRGLSESDFFNRMFRQAAQ